MDSQLVVTTPAEGSTLLTESLRREAVGIANSDTSQDLALLALDERVASAIVSECCVAIGSGAPPTLLQETLTETFRFICDDEIILSRRHEIEIQSISIDGVAIADTDYIVDPETGILRRLLNGCPFPWHALSWYGCTVVVVYKAGFADDAIPPDLMQAAMDFMRLSWSARYRDPALKLEIVDIPDVRMTRKEYWVGSVPGQQSSTAVPDIVAGQLQRYRNTVAA